MGGHARRTSLILLLVCASVVGAVLVARHIRNRPRPFNAETSAALDRLEAVWLSFPNRHAGKDTYSEAMRALSVAFEKCSPKEADAITEYLVGGVSAEREFGNGSPGLQSAGALLQLCWGRLVAQRDRARLVDVLRRIPANAITSPAIEACLGIDWGPPNVDNWQPDDLFTVLFDAHDQATSAECRKAALEAVQRSLRDQPGDPAAPQYISMCRAWYTKHRDKLEVVRDHVYVDCWDDWKHCKPLYVVRGQSSPNP